MTLEENKSAEQPLKTKPCSVVHPVSCGPRNIVTGSKGGSRGNMKGGATLSKEGGHWIEGIGTVVRVDQ